MLPKEWRRLLGALAIVGAMMMVGCGSTTTAPDLGGGGNLDGTPAPAPAGVLALMQAAQRTATYVGNDRCASCHGQSGRAAPHIDFALYRESSMGEARVGCEQCHGPGSNHATGPATDNIVGIPTVATEAVCGTCHAEQAEQYAESKHSEQVTEVVESARAGCVPCHSSAFRLEVIDQPRDDGEPINVAPSAEKITELVESTTSTVTCGNCHDPHRRTGNLTPDGGDPQLRRKVANTDLSVVGLPNANQAAIVGYDQVCAQCHMGGSSRTPEVTDAAILAENARSNFHENPQFYFLMGLGGVEDPADTDDDLVQHSNSPGQCVQCHMPNGSHRWEVDFGVSCSPCHSATDAQALATNRQARTQAGLDALVVRLNAWSQATFGNPDLWQYTSALPAGTAPPPDQIPLEVRRARHNRNLLILDLSGGVHNGAYADELLSVANANLTALGVAP